MTTDERFERDGHSTADLFQNMVETRAEFNRHFDIIENKLDLFTAALASFDAHLKICVNVAEETVKRLHEQLRLYQERASSSVPVQQL